MAYTVAVNCKLSDKCFAAVVRRSVLHILIINEILLLLFWCENVVYFIDYTLIKSNHFIQSYLRTISNSQRDTNTIHHIVQVTEIHTNSAQFIPPITRTKQISSTSEEKTRQH